MSDISKIDKNFEIKSDIQKEGIVWRDAKDEPFKIFGLLTNEEGYVRMPSAEAAEVSEFVANLNRHTSGGRVTFETDSQYLAISAKTVASPASHMTYLCSTGFDVYMDEGDGLEFYKPLIPPMGKNDYECIIEFESVKTRKFMIHFPLYSEVKSLYIGLDGKAELNSYNPYKPIKPIVFYGSSVTQGGCASRPGNNYTSIVSYKTGIDFTGLGFSGSAKGEKRLAEYIAGLEMSAFVYSYDINDIYDNEGKRERHYQFYDIVRKAHPDIPIIVTSAGYSWYDKELIAAGRPIIMETLEKARANGDNVYYVDGQTVYGEEYKSCATVDGCHPNDFGFVMMADAILKVFKECGLY